MGKLCYQQYEPSWLNMIFSWLVSLCLMQKGRKTGAWSHKKALGSPALFVLNRYKS